MENDHHSEFPQGDDDFEKAFITVSLLCSTSAVSMALKAAVELDVFEIIKQAGPGAELLPTEIAARLPTTNPLAAYTLDRILRYLACYQVVSCSVVVDSGDNGGVQRRYGLTPVSRLMTADDNGVSLAPLVLVTQHNIFAKCWQSLKDTVLDGGDPFNKANGVSLFEYNEINPSCDKLFNMFMHNYSTIFIKKMLDTYKGFEGIKALVDVGGGTGAILQMIVTRYPHIKGINFDQPHVISNARVISGVEHVGGDFFVSIPRGDAIFMKFILHDWSDDQCIKILKNCLKALPYCGKVIIVDCITPEIPETIPTTREAFLRDLMMMNHSVGGKERTQKELESLAKQAGFSRFKMISCIFNNWVMELYK